MATLKQVRLPIHVAGLRCHRDHADALRAVDRHALDRGIRLFPQTDFDLLKEIFAANADSGARLAPFHDPAHHRLTPENAFWIAGLDSDDRMMMSAAVRIFDLDGTSLRNEAESLRLFGPGPFQASRFSGQAAEEIRGRVAISGGGWVHPTYRGPGITGIKLARILRRAVSFLAYATRPLSYDVAWVKTAQVIDKGLAADYGFDHVEHGADFVMSDGTISPNSLVWSDAYELDEDMAWCGRGALRRPLARAA